MTVKGIVIRSLLPTLVAGLAGWLVSTTIMPMLSRAGILLEAGLGGGGGRLSEETQRVLSRGLMFGGPIILGLGFGILPDVKRWILLGVYLIIPIPWINLAFIALLTTPSQTIWPRAMSAITLLSMPILQWLIVVLLAPRLSTVRRHHVRDHWHRP